MLLRPSPLARSKLRWRESPSGGRSRFWRFQSNVPFSCISGDLTKPLHGGADGPCLSSGLVATASPAVIPRGGFLDLPSLARLAWPDWLQKRKQSNPNPFTSATLSSLPAVSYCYCQELIRLTAVAFCRKFSGYVIRNAARKSLGHTPAVTSEHGAARGISDYGGRGGRGERDSAPKPTASNCS
ncbi:hypothetical protein B0H63DRAFT_477837 [Podospora didyma]|uniref:Uncharacterized protein n=1 Tax=Podospora didyma TaxID=330526 RepID=A0AAE0KK76_9PEZI|nr:hypothetical protein B0H63DRAFT_477837 [Podospora didyma]